MAKLALIDSRGKIDNVEDDVGQQLVDLPGVLESVPIDELRYNGTAVVDAKNEADFFIDDLGQKWLVNDAPNAVEVSGTFDMNRRGGPNDAIQRTAGSWILDGFTVDSFVSVRGSAGADLVYKVIAVTALDLEFDESFERIPADENGVTITITQGWQKVPVSFNDVMLLDGEKWRAKTDKENQDDAVAAFRTELQNLSNQHVTTESPYPDRHRNPPEFEKAKARIINVGKDETPKFGSADLATHLVRDAERIYDKLSGSESVEVNFVAAGKEIVRTSGDWQTLFDPGMTLKVSGSASNDSGKDYVINRIGGTGGDTLFLGSNGKNLTDEGPVTCQFDGLHTVTGYETRRNEQAPGFVGKEQWRRFMEEAVAINWFAQVETRRKNYLRDARNSTIWATTTAYAVDDFVFDPESRQFYQCNTAHTATDFQSDLANWDLYVPSGINLQPYPTEQIES